MVLFVARTVREETRRHGLPDTRRMVSFFTMMHTMVSSLDGLVLCEDMMQHVIVNFASMGSPYIQTARTVTLL